MGLAKLCGFLATSVLLLILLVDSTAEGCFPPPLEPCSYPFVIKGTFQNAYERGGTSNFRITKVFRPAMKLGKNIKVKPFYNCYYPPEAVKVKEYIIGGFIPSSNDILRCDTAYTMRAERPDLTEVFKDISNNGC